MKKVLNWSAVRFHPGLKATLGDRPTYQCIKASAIALTFALLNWGSAVKANPVNPIVVNGSVTFTTPDGRTLEITNSNGSIINWQNFSIDAGEITRFLQPSRDSAILNRIVGGNPSQILGTLQSNGQIFLINPNGIIFGAGSVVDAQSLIASTLNLSDRDFLNGNYWFLQTGSGAPISVQSGAQIMTANGGQIWLLAPNITQQAGSQITAPGGQVVLAAGREVKVAESALGNMIFTVTTDGNNQLETLGAIAVERGAAGLFADNINHGGTINAASGQIVLNADRNLTVQNDAVIRADSNDGSDAGTINLTAGNQLEIQRLATVSADGHSSGGNGGTINLTANDLRVSAIANSMGNIRAVARHSSASHGKVTLTETGQNSYLPDGTETLVNSFTSGSQTVPAIATLAGGKVVVTWESNGQDTTDNIYARLYDPTTNTWSSEFIINPTTAASQNTPAIASLNNGNFVVTWQSNAQDGTDNIYSRIYDGNGNPVTGELLINTTTANDQEDSSITALANGGFVVAWESQAQDGNNKGVYARIYDAGGNPQTGELPINLTTFKSQDSPAIAPLTTGGFVITWQSNGQDGDREGVYARIYNQNGIAQTGEIAVNSTTVDEQKAPAITTLASGNFLITWDSREQDGNDNAVIGRIFSPTGNPLSGEFQVNTYTSDAQDTSAISPLADGGFIVSWESWQQDSTVQNGVYGQVFNAQGHPVGKEFLVNTRIINDQDNPAIALLPNGGFFATWESYLQDGSSNGIYSQRYAKVTNPTLPSHQATGEFRLGASWKIRPNFNQRPLSTPLPSRQNYPQITAALATNYDTVPIQPNASPSSAQIDLPASLDCTSPHLVEKKSDREVEEKSHIEDCLHEQAYSQMVGTAEYHLTQGMSWQARQAYWQERQQKQSSLNTAEFATYLENLRRQPEAERIQYYENLAKNVMGFN